MKVLLVTMNSGTIVCKGEIWNLYSKVNVGLATHTNVYRIIKELPVTAFQNIQ